MNRIELVVRCDCGSEVRSVGIEPSRLRQVIAAFDWAHDPGCLASVTPLEDGFPDDSESDRVSDKPDSAPDRAQDG
jgi:hypothetical protein